MAANSQTIINAATGNPDDWFELYNSGTVPVDLTSYQLTDNWTGRIASRYDFEAERAAKAGLGLTFRNECLLVDLSLSRRFTSSTSVQATTDIGLSVELLGFGGKSRAGPARACRG